ncbi:MAG: glycosyltransferase [Dehalococcoidia bacterium]|nr:MAG: glycosyltransferase [Dehalococcoidia bacterium]
MSQLEGSNIMISLIVDFRSGPPSRLPEKRSNVDPLDSAGTDGVSLEMRKRQALLEAMGHEVAICSAYDWADFPISALEFDCEEVARMIRNLFGPGMMDFASEAELRGAFDVSVLELKPQLGKVIEHFGPHLIFIHNILSLPVHPVSTVSLTELLRETQIPCAAIHHDVLSEGAYEFTPTCNFAKSMLEGYYPPRMPNLRHWTINTRNKRALGEKGVDAEVIHDTMDFDQRLEPGEQARIRARLRAKYGIEPHDVVLFVGARIVPNKQTELAGHLTAVLQSLRQEMVGKKLYHGEVFSRKSRVVLVLAGRPERAFVDYQRRLFELFDTLKIAWRYAGDHVRPYRSEDEGLYALYPDLYAMADFVLYPTGWEGFGNQLLEAFAAGLPVAVFEYPVFKEDIAPKGVRVVSLGDTLLAERDSVGLVQAPLEVLTRAAREIMTILTSPEKFRSIIDHNTMVGKRYFGFDVLRAHLHDVMSWASSLN